MGQKNCLIVGGNSFIGLNLAAELLKRGHSVKLFGRTVGTVANVELQKVKVVIGDLKNRNDIKAAISGSDVIYYFVSTSDVPRSIANVWEDNDNIVLFLNFMEELKNISSEKRIIYASSGGTVYGEPAYLPMDEDHPLNPHSPYGVTKTSIEKYLGYYHYKFDIDYVICRYANPFGRWQNPMKKVGAVAAFLYQHLTGRDIQIYGNPSEIIRDYIHIDDAVNATIDLAHHGLLRHRIYNIGSGTGISLQKILQSIEDLTARKVKYECLNYRKENVSRMILDIQRVKQELSWSPQVSFETGLELTKDWIEEFIIQKN